MRTGSWVPEERADLVRGFGRQDVFELAGLLFDFSFTLQRETIRKEPLRQPMAPNNIGSTVATAFREFYDHAAIAGGNSGRFKRLVARIDEWPVGMRLGRMWSGGNQPERGHLFNCNADRQRAMDFHALNFGDLSILGQRPQFFQNLVKLLLVGHREYFLLGNLPMMQFNAAISKTRDHRIMCDHDNRPPLAMKLAQQAQNDFFVDRVKIARGLIG